MITSSPRRLAALDAVATLAGCAPEPAGWVAALNDASPPRQAVAATLDTLCAKPNVAFVPGFNDAYSTKWPKRVARFKHVIQMETQFAADVRAVAAGDAVATAMATLVDTDVIDMNAMVAAAERQDDGALQKALSTESSHFGRFWYLADTHGMPSCADSGGLTPKASAAAQAVELGATYLAWWCWSDRAGGLPADARPQALRRIKEALAIAKRSPAEPYPTVINGDAKTFGGKAENITSNLDECSKATLATAADRAALLSLHP